MDRRPKYHLKRLEPKRPESEVIYGIHPLKEALEAGVGLEKVYFRDGLTHPDLQEIKKALRKTYTPYAEVPPDKLKRLGMVNDQGVMATISPITYHKLSEILNETFEQGRDPLIIVLDRVTDVGNLGAICRSAECFAVDAIVIPLKGAAQVNSGVVKASAGAVFNVRMCREPDLKDTLRYLKESGVRVAALTEKTKNGLSDTDLSGPMCVLMGSEEDGITPALLDACDVRVRIPMFGRTGSLNVSVSTGIALFEVQSQRAALG